MVKKIWLLELLFLYVQPTTCIHTACIIHTLYIYTHTYLHMYVCTSFLSFLRYHFFSFHICISSLLSFSYCRLTHTHTAARSNTHTYIELNIHAHTQRARPAAFFSSFRFVFRSIHLASVYTFFLFVVSL